MLTFDEMIAPTLRRREVTIKGLAGSPTLTFDAANASNPRWLEWVLGREERAAEAPEAAPAEGIAALRAARTQALELAAMVTEACLVSMVADDGQGSRVEYPRAVGEQLVRHLATVEPTAFLALFEALRQDDASGVGIDVEAVAGEASGG